jgi:hypothetical protein
VEKMSIRKKKDLYDFGDIKSITLMNMNKEDLLDVIQSLSTNIKAHKEREEVLRARLRKCYEYFEEQGLTDSEIINITKLDCELR